MTTSTMPAIPTDSSTGIRGLPPFVTRSDWETWVRDCVASAVTGPSIPMVKAHWPLRRPLFREQMAHAARVARLHETTGWAQELSWPERVQHHQQLTASTPNRILAYGQVHVHELDPAAAIAALPAGTPVNAFEVFHEPWTLVPWETPTVQTVATDR